MSPSKASNRALLEELARRAEQKRATAATNEALLRELFPEQRAFVTDPARRKAVLGSRRAGKTEMWSRYAVITALTYPRTLTRLWSHARLRAKDLLWAPTKYLLQRNGIPFEANETELLITLQNGSVIRLVGANQDKEAQKKRGEKTKLEVILETQNFPGFLQSLVDDVIEPSLMDEMGTVCLEGTPGPLCAGYWYEVSGAKSPTAKWDSESSRAGKWRVHRWTMLQNPFLPHARKYLEDLKASKRWADDNPTYLREYCGQWVNDLGSLFYSFDQVRNTYDPNKVQPYGPGWSHALGWDLGFKDDMAVVILGWNPHFDGNVYEVFSWKKPEVKDASVVMRVIDDVEKRLGLSLVESVADTGGGGRMYVEEVMQRFGRAFKPAKKTEKYEHVRLMNDDFITGKLKLIPGSPWAEEVAALQRDPDWPDPDKPESPPREDPRCANHACFVAGTPVLTDSGERPIETLEPGDLVLTRGGWRPVTHCGMTGIKPIVSHLGLVGTPDHPVWTENRGWVPLTGVVGSDILLYLCKSLRQPSGAVSPGVDTPERHGHQTAITSTACKAGTRCACTVPCGSTTTGRSLRAITSTISTGTMVTTESRTSSASMAPSTNETTPPLANWSAHDGGPPGWRRRGSEPRTGIAPMRVELGTHSTPGTLQPRMRKFIAILSRVWCAAKRLFRRRTALCVPPSALLGDDASPAWTTSTCVARSAGSLFDGTSTSLNVTAPVYAITVQEHHEFFANGVLVSNCDSALYCHRAAYSHFAAEVKPKVKKNTDAWALDIERQLMERYRNRSKHDWTHRLEEGLDYGTGAE